MAEFGSFGKGFQINREARQTAELNRAKAQAAVENERRDDARVLGESLRDGLVAARTNAIEVASSMNAGLVGMARLGQLDPESVAAVRQQQLLALASYAATLDELRVTAAQDPNMDETALRAMPSGALFVQNQTAALDAQLVEAMAESPIPKNKAEAEGMLQRTATLLGLESPAELSPEIRAKVAGTTIDSDLQLFFGPSGDFVTVDMSTQQGKERANKLLSQGYNATSAQFQSESPASLTGRDYTKFRSDMTATLDMLSQLDRVRVIMDADKPLATGLTREVAGFLTEAASQLAQASQVFGFEIGTELLGANGELDLSSLKYDFEDEGLRQLVEHSERLKFSLGALAFMRARALDPNDRLSGQEVQVQLNEIGRGKLTTLGAILNEIEIETLNRFNNRLMVYQQDPHFAQNNAVPEQLQQRVDRAVYSPGKGQEVPPEETELTEPSTEIDTKAVNSLTTYMSGLDSPNLADPEAVKMFSAMSPATQAAWLEDARNRGWVK